MSASHPGFIPMFIQPTWDTPARRTPPLPDSDEPHEPTLEEQQAMWAKAGEAAYEEWCNSQGGCVEGRIWDAMVVDIRWRCSRRIPLGVHRTARVSTPPPAPPAAVEARLLLVLLPAGPAPSDFHHGLNFKRDESCCGTLMHKSFPHEPYRTYWCPNCRGIRILIAQWTYVDTVRWW